MPAKKWITIKENTWALVLHLSLDDKINCKQINSIILQNIVEVLVK